ncbi:hypothetical protein [Sphingomonas sp. VNH70]|uniref:hypothetical protein n=1 Tax=Sphingomonas silueang TaxID=3156617 RepID=UPI0032B34D39
MTRINGADHVLLLLRDRLTRGTGTARTQATARSERAPVDRLRAMAGFDALDPDERRRAVVHALLLDELGDAVANDAAFRSVLDRVVRIVADLPEGGDLIDRAAAALREP